MCVCICVCVCVCACVCVIFQILQERQEQREGQRGETEEGKERHRAQQRVTKVGVWEAVVMCLLKGESLPLSKAE